MAEPEPPDLYEQPEGPPQNGRGVQGKYVVWICMPQPKAETIQRRGVKQPSASDFTRYSFRELIVQAHTDEGIDVVETACFLEPRSNGQPHLNWLLRASSQQWKQGTHLNNHPAWRGKSETSPTRIACFRPGYCSGDCCHLKGKRIFSVKDTTITRTITRPDSMHSV